MVPLGTPAPDFHLTDLVSGQLISLDTFKDKKALLVMFICRHCPYVKHVKSELVRLGNDYKDRDIGIVAISSNDPVAYPEDAPDSLREFAREEGFAFPLCFDETQEVALDYHAACTPDFFLYDQERKLVYRGQLDESRPGSGKPLTGSDLRAAIQATTSDQQLDIYGQRFLP